MRTETTQDDVWLFHCRRNTEFKIWRESDDGIFSSRMTDMLFSNSYKGYPLFFEEDEKLAEGESA